MSIKRHKSAARPPLAIEVMGTHAAHNNKSNFNSASMSGGNCPEITSCL